jgi:hypothetical protein
MTWLVDQNAEWSVLDLDSADTLVWLERDGHRIDAAQCSAYRAFLRDMAAIGFEAGLTLLQRAYGIEGDSYVDESNDDQALMRLQALSDDDFYTFVRVAFTLRAGFIDRLEHLAHRFQRQRDDHPEKAVGVEAFTLITAFRRYFGLAERGRRGPGLIHAN